MFKKFARPSLFLAILLALNLMLLLGMGAAYADTEYTVARGDTLTGIAQKFGVTVDAIASANKIVNVNSIWVGQKLVIPQGQGGNSPAAPTTNTPATGEQGYIVQDGDSMYGIAEKFGITANELAVANNMSVMGALYPGQTLKIPGKASAPTQPAPTATAAPAPTATPAKATGSSSEYIVQSGDSFYAIANRFGVSIDALLQANNMTVDSLIVPGQRLVIPAGGTTVAPKPTTAAPAPASAPAANPATSGKWIDVNLNRPQRLTAYEGSTPVFSSLASAGSTFPTPVGTFNIYIKYPSQAMSGPGYYLPGVPYVMYFYQAYAIHGTYWHNNFGNPMSHGCVNLPTPAAEWMYRWAPYGTPVRVHY